MPTSPPAQDNPGTGYDTYAGARCTAEATHIHRYVEQLTEGGQPRP